MGLITLVLLLSPVLSFIVPAQAVSNPSQIGTTEFQLFVTPAAPNLPADGNSYHVTVQLQDLQNGKIIEALEALTVTLISSDPSVVVVPREKTMLDKGESMIQAQIQTTDKAGVATITALAEGAKSSTVSVATHIMDSLDPIKLAIYAAPSSLIPDPEHIGMIYIQSLNSQNLPAVSKNDVTVDLSSSDTTVGRVPTYAVIPAGKSGVYVGFTPQKQEGQAVVTGSAPGLAPGHVSVEVKGSIAAKLMLEFAPNVIPAVSYHDVMMTVQLGDDQGRPVKASKNLQILLKSSDTSIVEVPPSIEILSGHSYVTVYAQSRGKIGTATISATATGYETGFHEIQAVELSTAGSSDLKVLRLYSAPSILPPDNSEHQSIVIAFLDQQGKPYRQTGWLYSRIAVSTSNTQVGEITSTTFTTKETYAVAKFTTKYAIGQTILTASLEGYTPTQMTLKIDGSGPAALALKQIPGIILANKLRSDSLVISIVDSDGKPVAAQEDTAVYLSSSDPEIARVDASTIIKAGDSHVVTGVYSTLRAGQAIITAAADGLASGSTDFRTVGFSGSISEYHLGLYVIPKLLADGKSYQAVVVQLQDEAGLPVIGKSDIAVSLSSASGIAGNVQDSAVIPAGSSFVISTFETSVKADSDFKITASSPGFTSVEATMTTTVQPVSILKSADFPTNADFGEEIRVGVDIFSRETPLKDATVIITGVNAQETIAVTDENGHAEGLYLPTLPGTNAIIIKATKPGYEEKTLSSRIILLQTVSVTLNAQTQGGNGLTAQLKVETPAGTKTQTAKPGSPVIYQNAKWGDYKITAQEQISSSNAVYEFVEWSDGAENNPRTWKIINSTEITAVYKAKYLLQISDPNGIARGGGYYDEGTTATITTAQTSIGGALIDKNFVGWSGDIRSSGTTASVLMDSPKSIKAEWADNYLKIAIIAAAAGGGGFVYYWKILKPKKEMEEKQRAPDLDWYKS